MLKDLKLERVLFLDIETVPQTYIYQDLDEKTKELFNHKTRFSQNEEKSFEALYNVEVFFRNLAKSFVFR